MGTPGFVVSINGQELVTVSSVGLNILTIQLHGDVVGNELASIDMAGGLYGEGDEDKHLIWLNDFEFSENDEIEIAFGENFVTSKAGRTISEIYPKGRTQWGLGNLWSKYLMILRSNLKSESALLSN